MFGNALDISPEETKIFYVNLNIGSTYAIPLAVIVLIIVLGYIIIATCCDN